jgi:hypothetical protein
MNFVRFYQRSLQQRPYLTQICSTGVFVCVTFIIVLLNIAGILMSSGDIISQTCIERRKLKDFDLRRTGRFGMIGMFFVVSFLVL